MTKKYFSLAEANRTLPFVSRIVADLCEAYPRWRALVDQYEIVAAGARPETGESEEQLELKRRIDAVAVEINGFLEELEQVGAVFKGFPGGLVDFYGRLEGRDVFWCWKHGEPAITHWHETDAGFAGRRPVPAAEGAEPAGAPRR